MHGLLDTTGKNYEPEHCSQMAKALEIVHNIFKRNDITSSYFAEIFLQKQGWLLIRDNDVIGLIGQHISEHSEKRYHLTSEQKEWLFNYYDTSNSTCRNYIDMIFERDRY